MLDLRPFAGRQVAARKSVPELAEEAARLERDARQQLRQVVQVVDAQLRQMVTIYEQTCGGVPRLQIESEIRKARSLLDDLKALELKGCG